MPGFTFEKIAPPGESKPAVAPAANERPRSPAIGILARFVEMRVRRKLRREDSATATRAELSED